MYISNGINTNGIKTNYFTGVIGKISNLTCNYANILELFTKKIILKGDISVSGNTNLGNTLIYSSENLNTTGSTISFTEIVSWLDTTGAMGDITLTLPSASEDNLLKIITLKSGSNKAIVNGNFLNSYTQATFNNEGESLTLLSCDGKWAVLSKNGVLLS